jgi:hypothetical protein
MNTGTAINLDVWARGNKITCCIPCQTMLSIKMRRKIFGLYPVPPKNLDEPLVVIIYELDELRTEQRSNQKELTRVELSPLRKRSRRRVAAGGKLPLELAYNFQGTFDLMVVPPDGGHCCVTCNIGGEDITACACAVSMSCGSCCVGSCCS